MHVDDALPGIGLVALGMLVAGFVARRFGQPFAIGPLDVLVNNVCIFGVKPFAEISDEEWLRFFDVNVIGNVRLIRHFLPGMLERNFGRIVNISSECGVRGFGDAAHYATTKTAQLGLTQSVAALTKGRNVTVNSVLPGPTWTAGVEEFMNGVAQQQGISPEQAASDYFTVSEPDSLLQRFIDPKEVAQVVVTTAANAATNGASRARRGRADPLALNGAVTLVTPGGGSDVRCASQRLFLGGTGPRGDAPMQMPAGADLPSYASGRSSSRPSSRRRADGEGCERARRGMGCCEPATIR